MNAVSGDDRGRIGPEPDGRLDPEEIDATEPTASGDATRLFHEPYGIPQVEARTYLCATCELQILAQEVVWEEDFEPHCPHCGGPLDKPD